MLDHATLVRLCRARDRLHRIDDDAPVSALAREAGVSVYAFIRLYAAVFGQTPHQQRIALRLERAQQLLACGDRSVTDVCAEVGFASLGSFSALFARRVGVAPSRYRRRFHAVVVRPARVPAQLIPGCLLLMGGIAALAIPEKRTVHDPQYRDRPLR
ncbi:helix-turn-helix domain-containing protein [Chiayiivirga flava]|uniref:AraC-like DNA-binding protein n=1 Tax=Chiayiivirga flava TaxID=659595 RepID=A0A7W8D6M5_9GAMM|nr:helix-turn-helix transcriptional regulator [Chiayiivirga flava]MBB5207765.1 AraC-like DNA-binding protein [Chiayiivirga flava]